MPVLCDHGVDQHPLYPERVIKTGRTWVRSKYVVDLMGHCIVCLGQEAPPDFPYDRQALYQANVIAAVEEVDPEAEVVFTLMPKEVSDGLPYVEP